MNLPVRLALIGFALLTATDVVHAQKAAPARPAPRPAATAAPFAPAAQRTATTVIQTERLRNYLTFIASDALGGRDTPSPGLDAAAEFIAFHLRQWGYKPAGDDGTFFQRIVLQRSRLDRDKCVAKVGEKALAYGTDFFAAFLPGAANGRGSASGALVYVGHGWQAKGQGIDPYAGVDVRGKILLVTGAQPKGLDLRGARGTDYLTPDLAARRFGAVGIVVLSAGEADGWRQRSQAREQMGMRGGMRPVTPDEAKDGVPMVTLSPEQTAALFEGEDLPLTEVQREIGSGETGKSAALAPGKTLAFTVERIVERQTTQNVVAVYPGSDPKLRAEHVALGAHYDHVGTRTGGPEGGDRIFNGADDDGSGTVAILSIAEAVARGPKPKRSLLFVWHCGEEKGLWGSDYFVNNPTVPIGSIVTQLNIDMIGRSKKPGDTDRRNAELSGPNSIYVIGSRMLSTQLGTLHERVNAAHRKLGFDYRYDDPKDPNRFYYRSDHYNYARKNIPIIFYFDGVHEDYHRPGDEVSKIDFEKMARITQTVYLTAMALADLPSRPVVDGKNTR